MIRRAASRNCNVIRRWIFSSSCRVNSPFQEQQKPFSSRFPVSSPQSPPPFPPPAFHTKMGFRMRRYCYSSQAAAGSTEDGVVDVPLAQTGEGIAECELLKWFVQEGDQVEDFQPLCEVQSDKATIEITSRYKGKVAKILYTPGDIVKVGETLLKMVVEESLTSNVTSDGSKSVLSSDPNALLSGSLISVPDRTDVEGLLSTPAVRSMAKKLGIRIGDVQGTGKDGRVLKEDVMKYAVQRGIIEDSSSFSSSSSEDDEKTSHLSSSDGGQFVDKRIPLRGFQRTMVKTMTIAAKVPHFHYVEEINCDALIDLKTAFQNENQDPDVKHTFLPLLIKSLSMAMSRYPLLNSCFSEETHEVILKGSHNIGVAMATQYGLVVPNIKKVQSLSILDITKELSRLQKLASANKLSPEDISAGTITLSNIGAIGGKFGSPLLNLPEVSIIAMGRIQKVPHFSDDGNVYPASVMTVNIGADHRVLDGATVARFCNEWKLYIEKPELLLLNLK